MPKGGLAHSQSLVQGIRSTEAAPNNGSQACYPLHRRERSARSCLIKCFLHPRGEEDAGYNELLGDFDAVGYRLELVDSNPRLSKHVDDYMAVRYREAFLLDGSKLTRSLLYATAPLGPLPIRWSGLVLVMQCKGQNHRFFTDVTRRLP